MKLTKIFAVFALCGAASLMAAEPALEVKLNEGSFANPKVQASGTIMSLPGVKNFSFKNQEALEWVEGREAGTKALYFNRNMTGSERNKLGIVTLQNYDKKGPDFIDFSKPFTLMCWVNVDPKTVRNSQSEIISTTKGDRGPGFRLTYGYDAFNFLSGRGYPKAGEDPKTRTNWSVSAAAAKCQYTKGTWAHVAATWDGTTARIYVNGVKYGEKTGKDFPQMTMGDRVIYVGAYRNGYAYPFKGIISDVKIFASALSDAEIMAIAKNLGEE